MAKIVLKNPYFEEEIKVKESRKRIADMLNWMEQGINPKHFAKIEIYED